jgi:hypothetical protein
MPRELPDQRDDRLAAMLLALVALAFVWWSERAG